MPDQLLEQKLELLREVVQATKEGLQWKRTLDFYTAPWKDREAGYHQYQDGPPTFSISDRNSQTGPLVELTSRVSAEASELLGELIDLILEQYREEDEAAAARGRQLHEERQAAVRGKEAIELNRLLS